jgi:hypothetical protein
MPFGRGSWVAATWILPWSIESRAISGRLVPNPDDSMVLSKSERAEGDGDERQGQAGFMEHFMPMTYRLEPGLSVKETSPEVHEK